MLTFQYLKSWADRVINTEHAPQSVLPDAMTDANKNVVGRADWQDHASELSSCASRFSRSSGLNANSTV